MRPTAHDEAPTTVGDRRPAKRLGRMLTALSLALCLGLLAAPLAAAQGGGEECAGQAATIVGTSGDDRLTGTPGDDVVVALEGNDTVAGLAGDDHLCGGDGVDGLYGGEGDDDIRLEDGDDTPLTAADATATSGAGLPFTGPNLLTFVIVSLLLMATWFSASALLRAYRRRSGRLA